MATSLMEVKQKKLDSDLEECGIDNYSQLSFEEKRQLLQVLRQSKDTAEKEEEERHSQIEPDLTDDESSYHGFEEEQRINLERQGVSLIRTEKDEDCVVIKEVPRTPRPISKGTPNATPSRIPQLLARNNNQPGLKSPHNTVIEHSSSTSGPLGNSFARRGIHDSPFKSLFSISDDTVFDHVSNVPGLDVLNCAKVVSVAFECEKRRKIRNEVPFHVRPAGMNRNEYLIHFNKNVDDLKRLYIEQQRKCLNFKQWGPPIKVLSGSVTISQIEVPDEDASDVAASNITTVSEITPHLLQESHYNLRLRNPTKRIETVFSDDDDDNEIIKSRSKILRYSALEDSISQKSELISNNQCVESTRGRDMMKNARPKQNSSNSQSTPDIIDSTDSNSDFEPAGKDISETRRALPPSNATATKRLCKKKESPTVNANKKRTARVAAKLGSWHNSKSELVEDTDLSPIEVKRRKIMDSNSTVFSKEVGQMSSAQMQDALKEDFTELDADVECPICKETFSSAKIEQHADVCCDSSMPDNVDENIYIPPTGEQNSLLLTCTKCGECFAERGNGLKDLKDHRKVCCGDPEQL